MGCHAHDLHRKFEFHRVDESGLVGVEELESLLEHHDVLFTGAGLLSAWLPYTKRVKIRDKTE